PTPKMTLILPLPSRLKSDAIALRVPEDSGLPRPVQQLVYVTLATEELVRVRWEQVESAQ
ncbi:MAG: hypothetical protein O2913_03220, partial [Chloroflexi bacterium]|nr:hypothetical protein [Chloroflexota bacterium]